MSDEDRDVDIESDEEDDGSGLQGSGGSQFMTQAEKRAHHNALERKRRDHIKESFHGLRDSVPSLQGEKVKSKLDAGVASGSKSHTTTSGANASRAQILKQATDYIAYMSKKNGTHQQDIDDLKKQNNMLENQVRALERAKAAGVFATQSAKQETVLRSKVEPTSSSFEDGSLSGSSDCDNNGQSKRKKLKVSAD